MAAAAGLAGLLLAATAHAAAPAQTLPGTNCSFFPGDSVFNTDISGLPVNAMSATWMSNMTQNANLHPDLGTFAQWYGIPINVAPPPSPGVTPTFAYNSESDHPTEGYPIDQNTFIEGGPSAPSGSDRHALVVDKNLCKLYEIFNLQNFTNGQTPQAGSGATWSLNSNAMRPDTWTSADAAGLPMAPLLLRPDEILAGSITHAIRFTAHCSANAYIWPASHRAGSCSSAFPPMGARFRLRASFNISGFSATTQVVLKAMQRYGLILADNGSDWFFGGTTDDWWGTSAGDTVVSEMKTIPAAQFDAIDESALQVAPGSYQAVTSLPPRPFKGLYTLDGWGGINSDDSPSITPSAYWPGWSIARAARALPGSNAPQTGFVLDGYGGFHPFGSSAPNQTSGAAAHYWGFDIARDFAFMPDGSGGLLLDGYGGLHGFGINGGTAPAPTPGYSYFGFDAALKVVIAIDGKGGYVLDAYGGVHPFGINGNAAPPAVQNTGYWGWRAAQDIVLVPGQGGGYQGFVLDKFGGLHPFIAVGSTLPSVPATSYFGFDIARGVWFVTGSSTEGYTLDGYGGTHPFGGAPGIVFFTYWPGRDMAREAFGA